MKQDGNQDWKQDCGKTSGARALMAQDTALHLFQIAALMLGDEQEAVLLVEEIVAGVEADPCANATAAHEEAHSRLAQAAVRRLDRLYPGGFAVPAAQQETTTCIDTDDLSAAGLSSAQLDALIAGPGRARMRDWLEHLAPVLRVIFVLRAVMGQDGEAAAHNLRQSGVPGAQSWNGATVGMIYRQALCSLATSLVSSSGAVPVPA